MFKQLLLLTVTTAIFASDAVVPNDKNYYKYSDNDIELIYTKDNIEFAKESASIEKSLQKNYADFYGWRLDETLHVGLISSHNQIANGFSTQWLNNRQINYIGGTELIDRFSSTSWLKTLLYHETAHNYQLNVKGSKVSQFLHKYIGNGTFLIPFVPTTVPNLWENSFMLEGNAVLNESWHGNGGRLYSGRYKVETILQAKAGNIIPSYVYNTRLAFPYGDILYIQGGFYNLYMAQKYGLKAINSYFLNHSKDWFMPLYTDNSMKKSVGINFEDSLKNFSSHYALMADDVVLAKGELIASSQFFNSLNSNQDEIHFLINESGVRANELVVLDKKSTMVTKTRDSYKNGKVIKADGIYFTQGSHHTSPTRIHQGLFDKDSIIKNSTESKMIQGYLSSGEEVYFDVVSSYSQAQLYVGDKFISQVNSSVIIDKDDNIYYFKQDKKDRTLYKNSTPLYKHRGFYSIVSDVDADGNIYFIANSELGSTLYRYSNGVVNRASKADNIVEAKLIDSTKILIAGISSKDYYYVKSELENIDGTPYETKLFFEDKDYYGAILDSSDKEVVLDLNNSYNSLLDMHYSSTSLYVESAEEGMMGYLDILFGDPLSQNSASLYLHKDNNFVSTAGMTYTNSRYLLQYSLSAYRVVDDNELYDLRDDGIYLKASLPIYEKGYRSLHVEVDYYQDYTSLYREPLTTRVTYNTSQMFGNSQYPNYLNELTLYGAKDREDNIFGLEYKLLHDLPYEFYIGTSLKYSTSSSNNSYQQRGVKFTKAVDIFDIDKSSITMPMLSGSYYLKNAGYMELSLAKVLNLSAYFFTFPISLQRESIYTKYRRYRVEDFSGYRLEIDEVTAGINLSTIYLNSFLIPITLEAIYSETHLAEDKLFIRFILGHSF